eukprot:g19779.t1
MLGAFKRDTLIEPGQRRRGKTDGSSFPNGGLRVTHSAAAFTTWDRASPPFVTDKCLYIPCASRACEVGKALEAFVTHFGKCIDEKTPLLRSMDAVKTSGLRLLKAINIGTDAKTMHSYLGWEQEFFVLSAALYKARPDLVNTGRTLFGKLPTRHQQGDLNYFQPIPGKVQELLDIVQAEMLKVGCPMAVKHNEPFAGINGSGKHANWSVGTDTGLNFFYPGKNEAGAKLYVTAIACLAYGLAQYNEMVRCTVAHSGNDHRLGAQESPNLEAPPAIISLYPGQGFEQFVESIVKGGDLLGLLVRCVGPLIIESESDRFRGGERGRPPLGLTRRPEGEEKENKHVIFTGNGYSAEWPVEAQKRGLPNLNTTPKAVATWNSEKNKKLFETLKIYTAEETEARQEENYISALCCEVETMIQMTETGFLPACAKEIRMSVGKA